MNIRLIASAAALVAASLLMVAALALAYLAWRRASLPLGLTSLLLLFTAPAIVVAAVLARNQRLEPPRDAPPHALVDALSRAEVALQVIKAARAHACVFAVHALVMLISELMGLIDAPRFVIGYIAIVAASLAGYLPWLSRQERRARDRCGEFRRAIREARPAMGY
jgi:hypothetical protein